MPTQSPISSVLPPLILGTAGFTYQFNEDPHKLPAVRMIETALTKGIRAFDTSPYYGPAEEILGAALKAQSKFERSSYFLQTKVGRIAEAEFDYSPAWIRKSVARSCERLGTDYLDTVLCHDVEFVSGAEVVEAVRTLREFKKEGKIRYVGISGYPVDVLAEMARKVKGETGEGLDVVFSYGNYTMQNTLLGGKIQEMVDAGVEVVLNGSPLGMGLLREVGVPVGSMGDFHPAPKGLRQRCLEAGQGVKQRGAGRLELVALRWALETWGREGAVVGSGGPILAQKGEGAREVTLSRKFGVTVAGGSLVEEVEELLALWKDVVEDEERKEVYKSVIDGFGTDWKDYAWASPGDGFVRSSPKDRA